MGEGEAAAEAGLPGLPRGWEAEAAALARAFLGGAAAAGPTGPGGRPPPVGPGAAALRAAVLGGDAAAAEEQLAFLAARGTDVARARFEVRRQSFYERLDGVRPRKSPATELLAAVQEMEGLCSREEFSELCYLMTLPSLQDSPEFMEWTAAAGRRTAVARLDRLLGSAGWPAAPAAAVPQVMGVADAGRLKALFRQALAWQQAESARRGSPSGESWTLLRDPWDVAPAGERSSPSGASAPRDLSEAGGVGSGGGGGATSPGGAGRGEAASLAYVGATDTANSLLDESGGAETGTLVAEAGLRQERGGEDSVQISPPAGETRQARGYSYPETARGEAPHGAADEPLASPNDTESERSAVNGESALSVDNAVLETESEGDDGEKERSSESLSAQSKYSGPYEGWEAPLGYTPRTILSETQPIRALEFSPSGHELAVGCNSNRALRVFSLGGTRASTGAEEVAAIEEHHLGSIYCLDWDPSGVHIASGSNDSEVRVVSWSSRGFGETSSTLRGHDGAVRAVRFASDGTLLASAGDGDGCVRLWDVPSETCVQEVPTTSGSLGALHFLVGSDSVLLAASPRGVLSVDRRTGAASELFSVPRLRPGSRARLTHLATSLHSPLACLAFSDGALLWADPARPDAAAGAAYPHAGECRSVDFSPCGRWTLSGGFDAALFISDPATGETLARCGGHQDRVVAARFHPGAVGLASGGCDGALKLWTPCRPQNPKVPSDI